MVKLLVVSCDSITLASVSAVAARNQWELSSVADVWDAMERLYSQGIVDVLLFDLTGKSIDAARTIRLIRKFYPQVPLLLMDRCEAAEGNRMVQGERKCAFLPIPFLESELEQAIWRGASTLHDGDGGPIKTASPSPDWPPSHFMPGVAGCKSLKSYLKSIREAAEKEAIIRTLEETHWNRKAAARLLNVSYRSILYKIEAYHLTPPDHCNDSRAAAAYFTGPAPGQP